MSLRRSYEDAVLTGEEVQLIRQVLSASYRTLTWAREQAGPQYREAVGEATTAATGEHHCPGWLETMLCLAIDYLDFAPSARRKP